MSLTNMDPNYIVRSEHREEDRAKRVYIVGGADLNVEVDNEKLSEALKTAVESIELPEPRVTIPEIKVPEIDVKMPEMDLKVIEVEKTITVPQIVEVEKTVVVKETEVKTVEIEKPVYIKELEIKTVDVPVITEKIIERIPGWVYSIFVLQFLLLVGVSYKLYTIMG